ncbi:Cdc53 cullin [Tubulinosema ratisbonensis]|uniref:Cdc53 cullin n=1 Tax=Tubulinosema ratisbonensis TaxID=291195 RepID=A0A437AJN4_9MICR|nr:Cdc53 cullin [Tubulinosema ratisbonensis]
METTIITEVSYKALNYPEKITSEDFINAYNVIFSFCSKPTNVYEIRGYPIYKLLVDILDKYTVNLSIFDSLEEFNFQYEKLEKSLKVLEGIFSYLTRYFIKTNIIKKNERDVKEIRQLVYQFYYNNHLKNLRSSFYKLYFFELNLFRDKTVNGDQLKKAFNFYKKVLIFSGKDEKVKEFTNEYIKSVCKRINFEENIKFVCMNVYEELVNLSSLFDSNVSCDINRRIVTLLEFRNEEMSDTIIKRIDQKKEILFIYKLIEFLGENSLKIFNYKYELFLKSKKNNFDFSDIFSSFSYFYVLFEKNMKNNKEIRKILLSFYREEINSFYLKESFDKIIEFEKKLIDELVKLLVKGSSKEKCLISFVKLIKDDKRIGESIIHNLQSLLLFNDNILENEKHLLNFISHILSSDDFYKSCHLINDLRKSNEFVYKDIHPKLLSKGFWPLKEEKVFLHSSLYSYFSEYVDFLGKDYKRSSFTILPSISKITISFNDQLIDINTDLASLLLFLEENQLSFLELKNCTNDPFLKENLDYLSINNFIYEKDNLYFINYDFNSEKKNYFRIPTNIFATENHFVSVNENYLIESLIMKILKNKKKVCKNELFIFMNMKGYLYEKIDEIINNLVRKRYCKEEDGVICYIP